MNLTQSIRKWDHSVRYTNVSSNWPIYTFAKLGAALVPIAVPLTWMNMLVQQAQGQEVITND